MLLFSFLKQSHRTLLLGKFYVFFVLISKALQPCTAWLVFRLISVPHVLALVPPKISLAPFAHCLTMARFL